MFRKICLVLLVLLMNIERFTFPVYAEDSSSDEDVYVLNFSETEKVDNYDYSKPYLYSSPYYNYLLVDEDKDGIKESEWSYTGHKVMNMINTTLLSQGGEGAYASIPVYCLDAVTDGIRGHEYRRVNLEDATYFDENVAARLRAVIQKVYPYNQDLEGFTKELNNWQKNQHSDYLDVQFLHPTEMITAAQTVIWILSNPNEVELVEHYLGASSGRFSSKLLFPYGPDGYSETGETIEWDYRTPTADDNHNYTANNITVMIDYLLSLEGIKSTEPVVSKDSFLFTAAFLREQEDGTYDATVVAEIDAVIDDEDDVIHVYTYPQNDPANISETKSLMNGVNMYVFEFTDLEEISEFMMVLNGNQVSTDVFLFEPKNGREASQTMTAFAENLSLPVCVEVPTVNYFIDTVDIDHSLNVKKVWRDADNQDGLRPVSVFIQLYVLDKAIGDPIQLSEENMWSYTWEDLPKANLHTGEKIEYTVKEIEVENYESNLSGSDSEGYVITNTHIPETINIPVSKVWIDSEDSVHPESIQIILYADGVETDYTAELNEENQWTHTFTGLAKFNQGKAIEYSVREINVPEGYVSFVHQDNDGKFIVVNCPENELINFSVIKEWNDQNDNDRLRPEFIEVQLYSNGEPYGNPVVLNSDNEWSYTWKGLLPGNGTVDYTYTVDEIGTVEHYEKQLISEGNIIRILNSHQIETITVSGQKTWDDQDNELNLRPDTICVQLLANGSVLKTTETSSDQNWEYVFEGLPKYQDGVEINYQISEVPVDQYQMTVNGYDLTNTLTIEQYKVIKLWKDENNEKNRPVSIHVHIFKNGELETTVELNESNQWSYSWSSIDDTIVWSVAEVEQFEHYTVSSTQINGIFTITNTFNQPKVPPVPETSDSGHAMDYLMTMMISGILMIGLALIKKSGKQMN